jgi:hypothetical protein
MPKPLSGPQLLAIAHDMLTPDIDDSEWRERIKCRLTAMGFDYPRPEVISAAMTRVEYVLAGQGRRRAAPMLRPWV